MGSIYLQQDVQPLWSYYLHGLWLEARVIREVYERELLEGNAGGSSSTLDGLVLV